MTVNSEVAAVAGGTNVLMLFPGPVYEPEEYFGTRLRGLSERFEGKVITFSDKPDRIRIGRFDVEILSTASGGRIAAMYRMFVSAVRVAARWRRTARPVQLIVTYDPLKTGLIGWMLAKWTGASLVVEVNGDYAAWSNYLEIKNRWVRRLKRSAFLQLERFVLRRAEGIKLLYSAQIDRFAPFVRHPIISIIPAHVDLSNFRDRGDSNEVLLVGFPFHVKGIDVLIEAFKMVAPRYPDWRLKILGWYPDPRELLAAIDGHPRIAHHPPVSHAEVAEHIGRCGILVLPSRTEAMGRVLLEAMACGKARIGTRVGGIPSVIEHERDGLLVEPDNVDELAEALDRLMGDPELRMRLGREGAARVEREFRFEHYVEKLIDFYERVLERARPERDRSVVASGVGSIPGSSTAVARDPRR